MAENENILDWVERAIRAETTINDLSSILQETYPDVGLMRRILMVEAPNE
ncbi:MAG: hypothetical protein IKL27_06610 [Oscillospiraceae bacterium]|nr:hypothetical protein [Oscillospiraceae bacterium]